MIKVFIVDDHKILVEGLCKVINESAIAEVVKVAHTAAECLQMLKSSPLPDVLMLDVGLPDKSGLELCDELLSLYPALKILVLTSYGELSVVNRMMEKGAKGYVLKNAVSDELLEGISTVALGERFLCHEIDLLLKRQQYNTIWLSERERQLLRLICEGYTNPEIAEAIFLSPETIKGYRKNLLFKLGAKNTASLVKIAIEQKLI